MDALHLGGDCSNGPKKEKKTKNKGSQETLMLLPSSGSVKDVNLALFLRWEKLRAFEIFWP